MGIITMPESMPSEGGREKTRSAGPPFSPVLPRMGKEGLCGSGQVTVAGAMEAMVELRNHPGRDPLVVVANLGEVGEHLHEQAVRPKRGKARQSEVMQTLR